MRRPVLHALALQPLLACACAVVQARPATSSGPFLVVDASPLSIELKLRQEVLKATISALRSTGERVSAAAEPRTNAAPRIDALLGRAKALSEQFQEQQAVQVLVEAEQLFRRSFGAQPTIQPLTQILLARIKLYADLGLKDELQQDLERLAVLEPTLALDVGAFPPQLVRTFREVQAELSAQQAALQVTTTPTRSEVWVDGRRRGSAPLRVEVAPGEHFVAAGPEGLSRGRAVTVQAEATAQLSLVLDEPQRVTDAELRARGAEAGAAWVVAVSLGQQGSRYQLRLHAVSVGAIDVPCRAQSVYFPRARLTWTTTNLGLELQERLQRGCRAEPIARRSSQEQPSHGSVLSSWWFWTLAATVVGGGAAAAVVLTRDNDPGVRVHLTR